MTFLNKIAAAAENTNNYMVGDGRSSQQHEYRREGAAAPNQTVETVHRDTSAGERAQRANDPTRTNPHNPDEMLKMRAAAAINDRLASPSALRAARAQRSSDGH